MGKHYEGPAWVRWERVVLAYSLCFGIRITCKSSLESLESSGRIVQLAQHGTEPIPENREIHTAGKTVISLGMGLVYCWRLFTPLAGNISG